MQRSEFSEVKAMEVLDPSPGYLNELKGRASDCPDNVLRYCGLRKIAALASDK
jgi:hypothetical protein